MDDAERRLQVSLRLKAARYLAGRTGSKGSIAMPISDLVLIDELQDEGITKNRLEEIEQMRPTTKPAKRSELDAIVSALGLPEDWFSGLYVSDRGVAVSDSLGAVLLAVAEDARSRRQAPEEAHASSGEESRHGGAGGAGAG